MRAVVHTAFGHPSEVLEIQDVAEPVVAPGHALVRIEATGIAKGDWLTTRGLPYIARPMYGIREPKRPLAGMSFAGVVTDPSDTDFKAGDAVFGMHHGTLAEYVSVPREGMVRKPSRVSFQQAAAVPVSGLAALQAVRDAARVTRGQRVLVIGASGGVGSLTVQIAKAFGAHVTGVASTRNVTMVRALGADDVVDYTRQAIAADGVRYDAIIDIAGNRPVSHLRRSLTPTGTLVIVGGSGGNWTMGFGRTVRAMMLAPFVRHRIVGLLSQPSRADLEALAVLMEAGQLAPIVDATFPLQDAPTAIDRVGTGRSRGALVVTL